MSNVLIIKYETSLKAKHKLPSHYFPKYTPGGATPTSYIMMAAPGARRKVRAQSTPPPSCDLGPSTYYSTPYIRVPIMHCNQCIP